MRTKTITGLLYELKLFVPAPLYFLINSYLKDRTFFVRHDSSFSSLFNIHAGISRESDHSPYIYNVFTFDIPQNEQNENTVSADETEIQITIPLKHLTPLNITQTQLKNGLLNGKSR